LLRRSSFRFEQREHPGLGYRLPLTGEEKMNMRFLTTAALVVAAASGANADILWNFNSVPDDASSATGTLVPATGSGTAGLFGGVTGTFASGNASGGSTDPDTTNNDSGWQTTTYAAQGAQSGQRGVEFAAATTGLFTDIMVTFDVRHSNTSSRFLQFSYDLGAGFSTSGLANSGVFEADQGGDRWYNNRSVAIPAAAANNAAFKFRISPVFATGTAGYVASTSASSYGSTGTLRYDMVRLTGIPTPGSAVLVAIGGIIATRRRRA